MVRITVHEANVLSVGNDLDDVARKQRSFAPCSPGPMKNRATLKMSTASDQCQPIAQRLRLAAPEFDGFVWPHHPSFVIRMQVDRNVAKCSTPFHHVGVIVRVGNGDGRDSAQSVDRFDQGFIQKRNAVPQNVAMRCSQK